MRLGPDGTCHWCHAVIHVAAPWFQGTPLDTQAGLLPDDVSKEGVSPFVSLTLSSFHLLGVMAPVREFTHREPGLHATIRALASAVSAAGVRVWDAGLLRSDLDDRIDVYTPDEIWIFDLAVDVIVMLGAVEGLRRDTRVLVGENVRLLDRNVANRAWKKLLKKAMAPPLDLRELRAKVPHHTPNPEP